MSDRFLRKAPFIIALFRILISPAFFYAIISDWLELSISIYLLSAASDVLDGYVARRYSIEAFNPYEAYLDPLADFIFVLISFLAFSFKHYYPLMLVVILLGMFLFFIVSSTKEEPIYDPLGKYYGIFLILIIGITLLFPFDFLTEILYLVIIAYSILLVIFRVAFIAVQRRTSERLNPLNM